MREVENLKVEEPASEFSGFSDSPTGAGANEASWSDLEEDPVSGVAAESAGLEGPQFEKPGSPADGDDESESEEEAGGGVKTENAGDSLGTKKKKKKKKSKGKK